MRFPKNSLVIRSGALLSFAAGMLAALAAVAAPPKAVPQPGSPQERAKQERDLGKLVLQESTSRRNRSDIGEKASQHLHAGNAHLWRLDLDGAAREFQVVLKTPGEFGQSAMDAYQAEAARGMARVCAERGQYKDAQTWLERFRTAQGSGCGNCIEDRATYANVLHTVWSAAAAQPIDRAGIRLRRLAAGQDFRPFPSVFRQGDSATYEKLLVRREARLALAEQLSRLGRTAEASALFKTLAADGSGDSVVRLAAARHAALKKTIRPTATVGAAPSNIAMEPHSANAGLSKRY